MRELGNVGMLGEKKSLENWEQDLWEKVVFLSFHKK